MSEQMHKPQPTPGKGLSGHKPSPSTQFNSKREVRRDRSPGPYRENLLRIWCISSICLFRTISAPAADGTPRAFLVTLSPARRRGGDAVGRPRSGVGQGPALASMKVSTQRTRLGPVCVSDQHSNKNGFRHQERGESLK